MGMPKTVKRLHKETNQDLIDDEVEAIEGYDKAIEGSDNPEAISTYEHIKGEEEEHIAELEGLDKMKADDITSEQAWEDFKAGYSDFEEKHIGKGREGDQASLEEKIDVLSAKISELNTDMSRLTDSVPQALGTIEEGKTLEDEAEEEQEEQELGEEVAGEEGGEEGGLFDDGEDDGLGEFFGDEEATDEDGEPAEGKEAVDENGEPVEGEEDIAESDEGGEVIDEGEEVVEDDAEDDSSAEDEGDYISMDEVMADDGEESEEDTETEETAEEEDKKEDEIIDKMVSILEKMDRRITHLERENAGLKKQLSERMKVQTEPRNVAKSRPTPNTNLKLVKGSYNRPPVSTQYVANQRDIGIGKKTTESSNTSVFRQGLNEVFENCERIANQNHF